MRKAFPYQKFIYARSLSFDIFWYRLIMLISVRIISLDLMRVCGVCVCVCKCVSVCVCVCVCVWGGGGGGGGVLRSGYDRYSASEIIMTNMGKWITRMQPVCSWWRHYMETFFALLALCAENSLSILRSGVPTHIVRMRTLSPRIMSTHTYTKA